MKYCARFPASPAERKAIAGTQTAADTQANELEYENAAAVKRSLKAEEGKALVKIRASYWLASEPVPDDAGPAAK